MNGWVNLALPYHVIPLSFIAEYFIFIREQNIDKYNLESSQGHYTEWNNIQSRKTTYYDSTYVIFLKLQKYRNEEQISGCSGLGRVEKGWDGDRSMRESFGGGTALHRDYSAYVDLCMW